MTTGLTESGMIKCEIDGGKAHSIVSYLKQHHPEVSIAEYKRLYPEAPTLSEPAKVMVRKLQEEKKAEAENKATREMRSMADIFGLGTTKAALRPNGQPIMTPYFTVHEDEEKILVPEVDQNYVFDIENVKSVLTCQHMRRPLYVWGYHGTGKTTLLEQIAARQNRAFNRVQHTINTEESHIIGGYIVRNGETVFNLGPLPVAMMRGHTYCADEYDRAPPGVLSVYQPVLEGKPLIIKEAPPELRRIVPHPDFLFQGTGNTNGAGDETGLYQGAVMQDAANYSRFAVTLTIDYMEPEVEIAVVSAQAGIAKPDAKKLVEFAGQIRESFKASRMSATISPRELIFAAQYASLRGGQWREGLAKAWLNRLSRTDKEVADSFAQRVFT